MMNEAKSYFEALWMEFPPFGVASRYAERALRPPSPAGTTLY
jgi:hypothetical protein